MKITVQIMVKSEEAEAEVVQEVARFERGPLRPDTLGLSLAETRAILAGLEQALVERQAAEFIAQAQQCPCCGRPRACKGHHQIVFRTPFGKLKLDSPQLYGCPCQAPGPKSVSPLAERLPERTSPELTGGVLHVMLRAKWVGPCSVPPESGYSGRRSNEWRRCG